MKKYYLTKNVGSKFAKWGPFASFFLLLKLKVPKVRDRKWAQMIIIYSQHLIEMFAQNVKVNLAKFGCLFVKAERVINK